MRAALYSAQKLELGCPGEAKCLLFQAKQQAACEGCEKCLRPIEPEPDPLSVTRIVFLTRIESMVNVGCKFGPNDLPAVVWTELVWLAMERQRMDRLIREQKDGTRKEAADADRKVAALRKETGVPPPGGSIFPRAVPMK